MEEAYKIDRDFLFKSKIFEITSISIEHNYDIIGSKIEGDFIISGDYRLHEISINKEDFSFKIPFSHEIRSNVNLDTVNLEITDFNYSFNNEDELSIHVEYVVSADNAIIEFDDEKSLDEFLDSRDVHVVDFRSDESIIDANPIMIEDNKKEQPKDKTIDDNVILNNISSEDDYVKYHIHIVKASDTLESITKNYGISLNTLKKYNTFESLELDMKLIIPCEEY